MHSIRDLEDTLNWSYDQIRDRIVKLENRIDGVLERGKNNKIFITEKGLSLLRKLKELEDNGKSVQNSVKVITEDLDNSQSKVSEGVTKFDKSDSNQAQIKLLWEQVKELKKDKRYLKERLDKKDQQIQQLLPAAKGDDNPLKGKSLWQVIREWLKQPAVN